MDKHLLRLVRSRAHDNSSTSCILQGKKRNTSHWCRWSRCPSITNDHIQVIKRNQKTIRSHWKTIQEKYLIVCIINHKKETSMYDRRGVAVWLLWILLTETCTSELNCNETTGWCHACTLLLVSGKLKLWVSCWASNHRGTITSCYCDNCVLFFLQKGK